MNIEPATDAEVQRAKTRCSTMGTVLGGVNVAAILARLDAEKARADAAERDAELYRNIQQACADLPRDWLITIDVERDAGTVALWHEGTAVPDFGSPDNTMAEEVLAAIDAAMKASQA